MRAQKDPEKQKDDFLESYNLYGDSIFRYALLKISDREKALDITQETFTRAWEYMVRGEEVLNMKALFYRIAHNLIIDEYRRKKNVSLDNLMEEGFDYGKNEAERIEGEIDGKLLMKSLDQLDEKYREALILRYINDLSVKEIAETLGESENNVSVRIHRGLEKARKIFEES